MDMPHLIFPTMLSAWISHFCPLKRQNLRAQSTRSSDKTRMKHRFLYPFWMILSCSELEEVHQHVYPWLSSPFDSRRNTSTKTDDGAQASLTCPSLHCSLHPSPHPSLQACLGPSAQAGLQLQEIGSAPAHGFLSEGDRNQRKPAHFEDGSRGSRWQSPRHQAWGLQRPPPARPQDKLPARQQSPSDGALG